MGVVSAETLHAVNGLVVLLFATWVVAIVLLEITESPTYEDVRD